MRVLPRQPLRRWAARTALILACGALAFGGYLAGARQAGFDRADLAALEARNRRLGQEAEALRRQLVEERLKGGINEQAKVDLQARLNDQRGEILGLREKVALYETLLSSEPESRR